MSIEVENIVVDMWQHRNTTINVFGKDHTHTINYTFNQQGFRSNLNYNWKPDIALFGCSLVMGIGVDASQITSAYFKNCQNYGVAGRYTNYDILKIIENFSTSELYSPENKLAVVWTDRDSEVLEECYARLSHLDVIHFFCSEPLPYPQCYKFIPSIDPDASDTHPGPLTHKTFYKILCALFNQ
jgi:hypothetical protein